MKDVIVGIDSGTSVVKAVAFTTDGRQIGVHALRNGYRRVEGGGVEQDMVRTWADTAAVLRGLAASLPDLASRTVAIAVTGQGDGTWLIDRHGEPVGDGWLWLDARAGSIVQAIRLDTDRARAVYRHTGTGLNACNASSQLLWMKRHAPERIAAAAHALHCKDWLYYRLTGVVATDTSEGTFTFGDFPTRRYSGEVLDALGLADLAHLLPPMMEGSTDHAPLTKAAATETGFLAGTPVALGYVDVACTAIGGGLYESTGTAGCSIVGSTGMHMRYAATAADVRLNDGMTGYTMTLPIPGAYTQMQSTMAATINLDWVAGLAVEILASVGVEKTKLDVVATFDGLVESAAPAQLLYHPYISTAGERGPFVNPEARASLVGLSDTHGYGDLVRAVFEGIALAARDCYAAMGNIPEEVRIAGGAGRSKMLRRILAAGLGTKVRATSREEAGAAGAAMMALVALKHYRDFADAADEWVTPTLGGATEPDPGLASLYAAAYDPFVATRKALPPVWHDLKALNERTTR